MQWVVRIDSLKQLKRFLWALVSICQEIQRVAKMQRDSSTGSTMQEINFWLGMEKVQMSVSDPHCHKAVA